MSDTASTAAATHSDGNHDNDEHLQLERRMTQAVEEGHDADIPSSAGFKEESRAQPTDHAYPDIEKGGEVGQTGANNDDDDDDETGPNVVWWDGEDDPENPYNWSTTRKILNTGCVSFQTFISPLASFLL
ncbi:hypothetical protein O1611_g9031 [Lasiodiplodia mahajangana]|uniref:Uncharacterized protein n=1 Tax=Lasiodiplodia mahajangana TaxID=1108764 RepID=A0ACC2JAT3_9PEZI|nr:hypothetical protein O1611_g9031 [Lasiodiplodia mahajangana]